MALDPLDPALLRLHQPLDLGPAYGDLADPSIVAAGVPPPPTDGLRNRRPEFEMREYVITNGSTQLVQLDWFPDFWYVCIGGAGTTPGCRVYADSIASGFAVSLGPGGFVKFPAKGRNVLLLSSNGSVACTVNVFAMDAEMAGLFNIHLQNT